MIIRPGSSQEQGFEEARCFIKQELRKIVPSSAIGAGLKMFQVFRIEVPIIRLRPLDWLSHQAFSERCFWQARDSQIAIAGVGLSWDSFARFWGDDETIWEEVNALRCSEKALEVLIGMGFYGQVSRNEWKGHKGIRAFVPRFQLRDDGLSTLLICNVVLGKGERIPLRHILKELDRLCIREPNTQPVPEVLFRSNMPSFESWSGSVAKVLRNIADKGVDKVVLARRVTLTLEGSIDPCVVLERLLRQGAQGYVFLFQFSREAAFLGVSPELLYSRNGERIHSDALAGTRVRGHDIYEDEGLRQELLGSDKEQREHQLVLSAVVSAFRALCRSYALEHEREVLQLKHQQHLLVRVSGTLMSGVEDKELCRTLHPTPAVGGYPTDKALEILRDHEPFDRGWFASPVGCFSAGSTVMAVAIRSCLMLGKTLHVFSGAGIVEGSSALAEWDETEAKIQQYLDVFYGGKE